MNPLHIIAAIDTGRKKAKGPVIPHRLQVPY